MARYLILNEAAVKSSEIKGFDLDTNDENQNVVNLYTHSEDYYEYVLAEETSVEKVAMILDAAEIYGSSFITWAEAATLTVAEPKKLY